MFRLFKRQAAPQLQVAQRQEPSKPIDPIAASAPSPVDIPRVEELDDTPIKPDISTAEQEFDEAELGSLVDAVKQHPAIEAALASMQTLKVFVTEDGVVYHVEDPARVRHLEQLLSLVQKELGQSIAKPVSLMAYSKLRSQVSKTHHEAVSNNALVEMVLHDAIERKSSDVYVAIHSDRTQIYFRTHGVRYLHSEISKNDGRQMARSLWALSRDGQHEEKETSDTSFGFRDYRVRANSMPDVRGNSVVLRLRDPDFIPPLSGLGYSLPQQRKIDELQWSAGGLAVISGETNSGKSTTLTSMMASMPETEMIIEIADPIEIEFDHITHVQFDHYAEEAERRFRELLAALVRQNPDTLFIGEIRDAQTATAAIDMSLQGKRVWGTVHSHSCLSTISRLEHLGIDASLLAQPGFLNGVINQSLVPIVCQNCCFDTLGGDVVTRKLHRKFQSDKLRFRNADGCSECTRGITGQTVVAEVMLFPRDEAHPSRQLIRDHDLAGLAKYMREEEGMLSKAAHAVSKIQEGLLDPILTEEIIGRIGTEDSIPDDILVQSHPEPIRSTDLGRD